MAYASLQHRHCSTHDADLGGRSASRRERRTLAGRDPLIVVRVVLAGLLALPLGLRASDGDVRACLESYLDSGDDSLTLGEMRRRCTVEAAPPEAPDASAGVVQERLEQQRDEQPNPFTLLTHKPNYLLPVAWNQRGWDATVYRAANNDPDYSFDDFELQFQLSIKVPLAVGLLDDRMDIYAAYTNRSFWQAYNTEYSQPFRETNHEPELWLRFPGFGSVLGFRNVLNRVGYVHQSNGKSEPLSRGWDRVYVDFVFERGDWALSLRPWLRVDPSSSSDNPDIEDYLGHGDMRVAWAPNKSGHVLSLMFRNQIESGFDRGATELSWSFPLFGYPWVKGYLQYFYGYGESLVDYDRRVNRIGIGLSFSDWLY